MKKRKSGVRKILLGIGILFLVFVLFIFYLVFQDLRQEDILKQEIVNVSNLDLARDDYKIFVKTKGDYAYVEEAIKKYYKELSDYVKLLNRYSQMDGISDILSVNSLELERPYFKESHKKILEEKKNTVDSIRKIANLCDEGTIKGLISREKVDDYYYDLFLEMMYTEDDLKEFSALKDEMQQLADDLEKFLDKMDETLNFLEKNNDSWFTEGNLIYFNTDVLVQEYNSLYSELGDLSDKLSQEVQEDNQDKGTDNKV